MGQTEIGIIGILVLMILLLLGTHVGFTMVLIGFFGYAMIGGFDAAISNMAILPFDKLNNYHFAVLPLFLLMSAFVSQSGIGKEAYEAARAWFGQMRGGLAIATVGACGMFAACSGSSLAGSVVMGKVAYPEMKRLGYNTRMAVGAISAGGTIGILIPPSMGFVIIGILAELSIGKLFMAGVIPGLLEVMFYMGTIFILCRVNPSYGPGLGKTTFKQKLGAVRLTWPVAFLFLLIMGGIYGGVFTPTEAGGIGAFGALVIGLVKRQLNHQTLWTSLMETAHMTAMIVIMLIGAYSFNAFLAVTQIPFTLSETITSLPVDKYVVLILILIFYIICGMFFDIIAVLILTIPVIYPTAQALGFDLIWYSVIMVRIIEIGMITPPFGINLFGLAGVINVKLGELYRGILPFVLADFLLLALLIAVPQLSLLLPSLM